MAPEPARFTLPKYAWRRFLREKPWIFRPLALAFRGHKREAIVGPDTEIVIEGMPRSANTFAYHAFRLAQGRDAKVAHHFHAPVQILYGVQKGIPCVLLLREPLASITSTYLRHPEIPLEQTLDDYLHFHAVLLPVINEIVVASFEEVTADYGRVIDRVNERFGTHFLRFEHTEENRERVTQIIREINREKEEGNEMQLAVPSERRNQAKDASARDIEGKLDPARLAEARRLYQLFLERAGKPTPAHAPKS